MTAPIPTPASVASRIRSIRRERGWSLADVEKISKGSLKAVVLGSYERGDRSLSINRAIEIARLYSIPLHHLLEAPDKSLPVASCPRLLVDLRRARLLSEDPTRLHDRQMQSFYAFLVWIASRRGDWNGEVLSLREGDRAILSLTTLMSESDLERWLVENRLVVTEPSRP